MLQRSRNGKNRKKTSPTIDDSDLNQDLNIIGNRIVDLQHMSRQMQCTFCNEPLLLQDIEKETPQGIGSIFDIRCRKCLLVNKITSGKEYQNPTSGKNLFSVNTKATLGK